MATTRTVLPVIN